MKWGVLRSLVCSRDSRRPVLTETQEDLQCEGVLEQVGQNWEMSGRAWGHGSQGTTVFILIRGDFMGQAFARRKQRV